MSIENNKKLKLWELDRLSEEQFKSQAKNPLIVILDDIRSLNNIGSFFERLMLLTLKKFTSVELPPAHHIKTFIKLLWEQLKQLSGNTEKILKI